MKAEAHDWALVLGASSGFGAASARAFAREGMGVFGAHFDLRATAGRADAVIDDVRTSQVPVHFHNGNAADLRQRDAALDAWTAAHPDAKVRVLLHSLAFGSLRPVLTPVDGRLDPASVRMTLDVMAHSLLWWTQAITDRGLWAPNARIFAMTSSGSQVTFPAYGAVSAAKAALEAHVRQLAVALAPQGVTVNAIMAGLTRTPALDAIPGSDALAEEAAARNPSGRLTTPDDVARCLVSLCDAGTAWMTGNTLRVDGGETLVASGRATGPA